ncbi:hypothetical protein J6590_043853 [Homalodisca vitripennis]|nr:hypothetical protein J6590_043853 [Homalodisca vitripennis]
MEDAGCCLGNVTVHRSTVSGDRRPTSNFCVFSGPMITSLKDSWCHFVVKPT